MAYTLSPKALEARRKGGRARAKSFTSESQALAGKARGDSMTPCERTILGRQGYVATLAKYGPDKVHEVIRKRELANPSKLEQQAIALLDTMGLRYTRQEKCFNDRQILIDLYLVNYGVYIEVCGWHHYNNPKSIARDVYVVERLTREGRRLIMLDYREITSWQGQIETSLGIGHKSA